MSANDGDRTREGVRSHALPMNIAEFEVWLRYLVEELGTLSDSAHSMLTGPAPELRGKLLEMQWRIDSLRRFYDFTLAEVRSENTRGGITAARDGESAHLERGVSFIHAELQRARDAVAGSRRSFFDGQIAAANSGREDALQAHADAERRIDAAEERGWDTESLRTELDDLTLKIADILPNKP